MAPIHDTDIAEKRWDEGEWQYYELWEKIEHRLRRRRWLWVAATVVVFLLISSVPILTAHWSKWEGLALNRRLAQEIGELKLEAARSRQALKLVFPESGELNYTIESAPSCTSTSWKSLRTGTLTSSEQQAAKYRLVSPSRGEQLGIPGLALSFCYDSLVGAQVGNLHAFAITSVNDLAVGYADRASVLILEGPSAEMSFE
jgi:hypothetical protein